MKMKWTDVYKQMPNRNEVVWAQQESGNISLSAYIANSHIAGWAVASIIGNKVQISTTEFLMKVKYWQKFVLPKKMV